MKTIKIGGVFETSALAQGCMRHCKVGFAEAQKLVKTAIDNGITFFDHADVYGFGASEEMFGKIHSADSSIRHKIHIQTKCTLIRDEVQTLYNDQSKKHIINSVEESLKRLKTDYIDLYMLHAPDTLVEPEEVSEAFDELYNSGKVKYFGVSNHKALQIELLQKYLKQKIIVNQLQFSAAHTDVIDSSVTMRLREAKNIDRNGDVISYCRVNDISIQAWSPFQYGFYGGVFIGSELYPQLNEAINRIALEKNASVNAVAVAWLLRHPAGIQPLIGTTNADRLTDICTATDITLSREEWYDIYRMSLADEGKDDMTSSVHKDPKAKK